MAVLALTAAACAPRDMGRELQSHMAIVDENGLSQRDCVASSWYGRQQGESIQEQNTVTPIEQALRSPEGNAECQASRRLIEEFSTGEGRDGRPAPRRLTSSLVGEPGLFRTYRCAFRGREVEFSYSVSRNERDGSFSWCEYAVSGDTPFRDGEIYTEVRTR